MRRDIKAREPRLTSSFRQTWSCGCVPRTRDTTGCLTFPDYVEFWQENKRELENDECMIQMAFAFFDKDGDGTVDKQEFLECLQLLGDPLTQEEIDRFFEHVRARMPVPVVVCSQFSRRRIEFPSAPLLDRQHASSSNPRTWL